jgi:hypothetical protein
MELCSVLYITINLTLLDSDNKSTYEKQFLEILENIRDNIHDYASSDSLFYIYKIDLGKINLKENIYANIFLKFNPKNKVIVNFNKITNLLMLKLNNVKVTYNTFDFSI